ncbi:Glutamyl-tRNA synthetase [Fasciola hepatica]|uniref:Nondiscriminating glutamyl-tRNA synthetase EARS2, mitochondrial n=1 Tax=Fasciola hepatica TaxID=6192 RepID=A0A4E0RWS7_FASHE|nr:Glutamyl-tRNA synthetase [Fasciola hepatica]
MSYRRFFSLFSMASPHTILRPFLRLLLHHVSNSFFYSTQTRSAIRVRFAPSPTGFMHVGGLRTAFVNKLLALQKNGKFILRIEDTDKTRCHPEALRDIVRSLEWSGLSFDEGPGVGGDYGPYFQSERKSVYIAIVNQLLESGMAYRCFCSSERLELLRNEQCRRKENPRYDNRCRFLTDSEVQRRIRQGDSYTVRFKVPLTKVTVNDLVFGPVEFETDSQGDFILLKSDGMPVYHLANVVDDHHMAITHVIRGVEWLSSTPKHLLLYRALNWSPPAFAHLPLLLSSTGGKLSKRSPEFALVGQVRALIAAGYLPSAVLAWLASVGTRSRHHSPSDITGEFERWSPQLQMADLVSRFNLNLVSRQNVTISADMLRLCGRVHFDRMTTEALDECLRCSPDDYHHSPELLVRLRQYLKENLPGYHPPKRTSIEDDLRIVRQLRALQGRISCMSDLIDTKQELGFLWKPVDPEICLIKIKKSILPSTSLGTVSQFIVRLAEELDQISHSGPHISDTVLTELINANCAAFDLKHPTAMGLLRICLTGQEMGIPVVQIISLLTPKQSAARLKTFEKSLFVEKDESSSSN